MAVLIVEERERFEREYGCSEDEWRGWMHEATGGVVGGAQSLRVAVGAGHLLLHWQPLPPRTIALIRLPRLRVSFAFEGAALDDRREFLRRFDLHLQRGGG